MKHAAYGLTALCFLVSGAFAQSSGVPAAQLEAALQEWQESHGSAWRVAANPETGAAEMLYGGGASAPFQPTSDVDWFNLARFFVADTALIHEVDGETLVNGRVTFLPLGQVATTDKMTVSLIQEVGGVPVLEGGASLLFAMDGTLLSLHTTAAANFAGPIAAPAVSAAFASDIAVRSFTQANGLPPSEVGEPFLAFARIDGPIPMLVWRVRVGRQEPGSEPLGSIYSIDAATGAVAAVETSIHNFDVLGNVATMATPGTLPDQPGNPETQMPMAYARVTSSAGSLTADVNGAFNFVGQTNPLDITVEYVGTFNDVDNANGSNHSVTMQVQPDQPTTILMNGGTAEQVTAEANAYLNVGVLRDWVKSVFPTDTTADFQASSNVNIDATCNAFFDGDSINFYAAGGNCVNTAYSTVVAHELGHWLNVLYGTNNGSDGMGEGNADVFAMYVYDTPIVGEDFSTGGSIRSGLNTRQFCGDACGGCYGQVHRDGEVWMGTAWKVRTRLNQSLGGTLGDLTADTLFLGWMNAFDQTQITTIIEAQWLTLDDDDANIDNGTPNFDDIDGGFREQGFPGFLPAFLDISNVTVLPDTQIEAGPYTVDATIVASFNPPVTASTLSYRVNGGAFVDVPMVNTGGSVYSAAIPNEISPATIEYFISAADSLLNPTAFPTDAPTTTLEYHVGTLTVFLDDDFESSGGWTVGDVGDAATTGVWERVDPIGTSAQPEDDHTLGGTTAWVTGQGTSGGSLGDDDVDNGKTTLLSPVFDVSTFADPVISYWRWYSNNEGGSPNDDLFEVDISNDGGASWVSVETVGPGGVETNGACWRQHEFQVSSLLPLSSAMRLRFIASDLGDGSIIEAGIDDVLGTDLSGSGGPVAYCDPGNPNSVSASGAILASTGGYGTAAANFEIADTPAFMPGVLFTGASDPGALPFGCGLRCVGDAVVRYGPFTPPPGLTSFSQTIDMSLSTNGRIQWWYRDPAHMSVCGDTFNLSNALRD